MSDPTGTPTEPVEPPVVETPPVEPTEPDPVAELEKWKALARQNEARAKTNAEKAKQFDALEEANKTELQKAQEAAATAAAEATQARLDALRARTAATHGVPERLLVGSNEEELTASVQELLAFKGTEPVAPRSSGSTPPAGAAKPVIYTTAQISDPAFFQSHRADILLAQREGRILT
jgi:hypothetical protein